MDFIVISLISLTSALFITIVIEAFIAFLTGVANKHDQIVILLVNVVTNSVINIILMFVKYLIPNLVIVYSILLILEVLVVIVESLAMKKFMEQKMNFLLLSILMNVFSFIVGTGLVNQIVLLIK